MTLDPSDLPVHGLNGPIYKVGPKCHNPSCERNAESTHHLWRRSDLGKPRSWVEIEGRAVGNLTGLCVPCHTAVTGGPGGHKAAVLYEDEMFWWCLVSGPPKDLTYHKVGLLDPQPPTPASVGRSTPQESGSCPFCGREKRRRSTTHRVGRRRKSWTVPVPAEAEEDGAEVLDALVDDLALVLGVGSDAGGRYYVLVPALVYAQQDRARFVESLAGRGG